MSRPLNQGQTVRFSPRSVVHNGDGSDIRNFESIARVPLSGADPSEDRAHNADMAHADWHLQEWMALAGKIQTDIVKELGWGKRRASEIYNGDQQFKRDTLFELATWLGIEPYELLMEPSQAMQLRALRESARAIAAALPLKAEREGPFPISRAKTPSPRPTARR